MADKRFWFKMDVGYLDNPKINELLDEHPRAIILHLFCIAYSKQHGTDGRVPMRLAMRRACAEQCDLDECIRLGILTMDGDAHVQVRDYVEHQGSAEDDQTRSDKARRAARTRWSKAQRNASSTPPSTAGSNASSIAPSNADREIERTTSEVASDPDREDVNELCNLLADAMETNGCKRPTITNSWKNAFRLLLDRDQRPYDEAKHVLTWSQADPFWQQNIHSPEKFRKQYDRLRMKAGSNIRSIGRTTTDASGTTWDLGEWAK